MQPVSLINLYPHTAESGRDCPCIIAKYAGKGIAEFSSAGADMVAVSGGNGGALAMISRFAGGLGRFAGGAAYVYGTYQLMKTMFLLGTSIAQESEAREEKAANARQQDVQGLWELFWRQEYIKISLERGEQYDRLRDESTSSGINGGYGPNLTKESTVVISEYVREFLGRAVDTKAGRALNASYHQKASAFDQFFNPENAENDEVQLEGYREELRQQFAPEIATVRRYILDPNHWEMSPEERASIKANGPWPE